MTRSFLFSRTHRSNLTIEPATLNGYYGPKAAEQVIALDQSWQNYIYKLNNNNLDIWEKIIDANWGPTKGMDNGKLHLIVNGYWMQPINELSRANGWVKAACLNANDAPPSIDRVNRNTAPDIIHRVTMQNRAGQLVYNSDGGTTSNDNAYVPMITTTGFIYFPASIVAAAARVTALPWLNVRSAPSAKAPKIATLYPYINSISPIQVQVGEGGVWARTAAGWVALRYNGQLMTSWAV